MALAKVDQRRAKFFGYVILVILVVFLYGRLRKTAKAG